VIQTPRITYRARDDATSEVEISSLAAVYRIVLNAKRRARIQDENGADDAKLRSTKGVRDVDQRSGLIIRNRKSPVHES
jgi:hypothetical protein